MESFTEHYDSFLAALHKHMPDADLSLIQKAVTYADEKHSSQQRKDGSP